MARRKIHELKSSPEMLITPPGELVEEALYSLIEEAQSMGLPNGALIYVTRSRRTRNFDDQNPSWEDKYETRTLIGLKRMYARLTGSPFEQKKYDDI
jgi:hypothetical protein